MLFILVPAGDVNNVYDKPFWFAVFDSGVVRHATTADTQYLTEKLGSWDKASRPLGDVTQYESCCRMAGLPVKKKVA